MIELAKSDIFFIITTVAVIVLSSIIATLLVYLFIVIRDVKKVVERVKEESGEILEDVKTLRLKIRAEGTAISRASAFFGFFKNVFLRKRGRSKRSKEE